MPIYKEGKGVAAGLNPEGVAMPNSCAVYGHRIASKQLTLLIAAPERELPTIQCRDIEKIEVRLVCGTQNDAIEVFLGACHFGSGHLQVEIGKLITGIPCDCHSLRGCVLDVVSSMLVKEVATIVATGQPPIFIIEQVICVLGCGCWLYMYRRRSCCNGASDDDSRYRSSEYQQQKNQRNRNLWTLKAALADGFYSHS